MNKVLKRNEFIVLRDKTVWQVIKRIPKDKVYRIKSFDGNYKDLPFGTEIRRFSDLVDKL